MILIRDFYDRARWYALREDAGRWAWSECAAPDPALVLGFGARCLDDGDLTAYFSLSRASGEHAPDYGSSLRVFFRSEVLDLNSPGVSVKLAKGLFQRTLSIRRGPDAVPIVYRYRWPFYRQLGARVLGDPFNFTSQDFLEEMYSIVRAYAHRS